MANHILNEDTILKFIQAEIKSYVCEKADEIIEEAKNQIEDALRESIAEIVLKTQSFYAVERYGTNLIITVRNDFKA